jgi:hypothetical protein
MADAMIHACTNECQHRGARMPGGILTTEPPLVLAATAGQRVEYLGRYGDADWSRHTWRVGGKPYRHMRRNPDASEGKKTAREIKCEYRREVYAGSGPVGPIDFSRPAPAVKQVYPAPTLTSHDPLPQPASGPAASLLSLAMSFGWDGTITMARGYVPHATHGMPSKDAKFSEAVRLSKGSRHAVAVRMGGSWSLFRTWGPDEFFVKYTTLEAFQGALT